MNIQQLQYQLAICAIFQNEAPFLTEWIEYHLHLGVEHFYLYNDRSEDYYYEVLKPYIDKGIVELSDCPCKEDERHFFNQRRAHVQGLNAARFKCRWIAFIDIDEFIVPKENQNLLQLLGPYQDTLGVVIPWQKFGTSGYWELPKDALMIECLTQASLINDEDNRITKSIIQIAHLPYKYFDEEYVINNEIDLVHFCLWEKYDGMKAKMKGWISHKDKQQVILDRSNVQINHYWCRNESYYRKIKVPRKARLLHEDFNRPLQWPDEKIESLLNIYNQREDLSIQRFVPSLKKKLGKIGGYEDLVRVEDLSEV